MQGWFGFYTAIGGFAATLMGLLFVAVSINAAAVLSEAHEHAKRLAEQAFQNYLAVLMVSLLAIFPTINIQNLGIAALSATAVWAFWVLIRIYLTLTRPHEPGVRRQLLRRQISSLVGFGMLVYAAARMAFGPGDTLNVLASAMIVLLFSATVSSWQLLLRLAKARVS